MVYSHKGLHSKFYNLQSIVKQSVYDHLVIEVYGVRYTVYCLRSMVHHPRSTYTVYGHSS
ncbi:hypothetical protein L228DRAFT_247750 [Xylona heveae TC161]|uniref:Uncharacterized protein n=1 Tax=Xylona heveae (strain CBS 132557 / TC161) TaxID=1328760 RepID=A0A165GFN8_XYLHT|nr:hypothetical protein L228DRAFT_247750 [Xylona heveae TC161]KZF22127.1 hypothetical protein L228DRAFT_247750 [Xylona heveae TC161]